VGEVDHVHDAEDERQPGGHEEEGDAELEAVEELLEEERVQDWSGGLGVDQAGETLEVGGVEGQKTSYLVDHHRGDDVGVVDLSPCSRIAK
jgi:expansin (peptidoglycan-binding protein)